MGQTFASKDHYFHAIVKDSWEQCRAAVIGSKKNDTKRHIWVCAYAKIDGKDVCPFRVTLKPVEAGVDEWMIVWLIGNHSGCFGKPYPPALGINQIRYLKFEVSGL